MGFVRSFLKVRSIARAARGRARPRAAASNRGSGRTCTRRLGEMHCFRRSRRTRLKNTRRGSRGGGPSPMHRPRGSIDRCSRARHWASKGSNRGWGATQCPTRELDLSDRRTSSQGSSLIQCRTPNGQSSVRHEQGGRSVCPQAAPQAFIRRGSRRDVGTRGAK